MALDWDDTGGSQFFITHSPQPHLDARYTVFGRVVAGMDVVDQMSAGGRDSPRADLGRQQMTDATREMMRSEQLEVVAGEMEKGATAAPFFLRVRSA